MKEPAWIELRDALTLHNRLIDLYGGARGLRDAALLASALARPRQIYSYGASPDVIAMAAAYSGGVVRNHSFLTATSVPDSSLEYYPSRSMDTPSRPAKRLRLKRF